MKQSFFLILATGIVFFIYLGMAYITTMPQKPGVFEISDAIDIFDIKTQTKDKLNSKSKKSSLNLEPQKSDNLNLLQTQVLSDSNNNRQEVQRPNIVEIFHDFTEPIENNFISENDNSSLYDSINRPLYPYEAYRNNINGWVLLKLYISKTGVVVNVEVLDSKPKGIFENIAVKTAYDKVFPVDKNNLDPKKHTRNLKIQYKADQFL